MGLDMYLHAKRFEAGYDHVRPERRQCYQAVIRAAGFGDLVATDAPHAELSVCAIYWRKANAIHRWFVENVQGGKDDCGDYYVSREKLGELRAACAHALAVAEAAEGQPCHAGTTYRAGKEPEQHFELGRAALNSDELARILPTQSGFFFGSTAYDEGYFQDLEHTVREIDRVLAALPEGATLEYHSSW